MPTPPILNIPIARAVGTVEVDMQERQNLYLTFQSVGMKLHPVVSPDFKQIISKKGQMAVFLNRPGTSRALMLIRSGKPPVFFFTKDPLVRHLKPVQR